MIDKEIKHTFNEWCLKNDFKCKQFEIKRPKVTSSIYNFNPLNIVSVIIFTVLWALIITYFLTN